MPQWRWLTPAPENTSRGMDTRHQIGLARGILMERYGLNPADAFAVLRRHSQDQNVKMAFLAGQLISTGHLPGLEPGGDLLTDAHHLRRQTGISRGLPDPRVWRRVEPDLGPRLATWDKRVGIDHRFNRVPVQIVKFIRSAPDDDNFRPSFRRRIRRHSSITRRCGGPAAS